MPLRYCVEITLDHIANSQKAIDTSSFTINFSKFNLHRLLLLHLKGYLPRFNTSSVSPTKWLRALKELKCF